MLSRYHVNPFPDPLTVVTVSWLSGPRGSHSAGKRGAHLLVDEDPEEIVRGSEELLSQAEFTGGDLDASVDWGSCAARG